MSGGTQLDKTLELAKFGDMELVGLGDMVLAGLDRDMPHPLQLRPGGNAGLQCRRREVGLIEALNSLDKQQVVLED